MCVSQLSMLFVEYGVLLSVFSVIPDGAMVSALIVCFADCELASCLGWLGLLPFWRSAN